MVFHVFCNDYSLNMIFISHKFLFLGYLFLLKLKINIHKKTKIMKNRYSLLLMLFIPLSMTLFFAGTLFHSGSPGGKSGSPGDNGTTCTQCHNGTATPMEDLISTNIPELGYVVGETYELVLQAENADAGRFGFELTAEDEDGNKVGQFIISGDGETQLVNNGSAISHTSSGITPESGMKSWTFEWTAPETDIGIVTFYSAVNAANNNGGTSGDVIYTSTLSVDESSVGINDDVELAKFSLSPNPSVGHLNISHDYSSAQISIVDLSGKTILQLNDYFSNQRIDLSHIKKGIYLVQLKSGTYIETQKLVLK